MVVDIIIVVIVLLSTLLAYRKGLINLAIGLVAFIIAFAVTVILYKPVANLIINVTSIDETVENVIYEKANDVVKDNNEDENLKGQIIEQAKSNMLPQTARTLSINIVTGIVWILLFALVRIGLIFVTALANIVAKLPIIKQLNKVGGIIYGILRGLLIIYALLLVMGGVAQINSNNKINNDIDKSYIAKPMYENNILNVFFEKVNV